MGQLAQFGWVPVRGVNTKVKPRVKTTQFGDGYSQRAPDGVNNDLREQSVEFKYSHAEIQLIDDFLTEHGGVKAFEWCSPDRPIPKRYICEEWSFKKVDFRRSRLTAKFKEVVA